MNDFGSLPAGTGVGVVLLFDDTMPAYRVASGLIALVDVYPNREAFDSREELDAGV